MRHAYGLAVLALLIPLNAEAQYAPYRIGYGSAPTAAFTARIAQGNSSAECVIPCAVHFDAIGDSTTESTDPLYYMPMAGLFTWDFDNAGAGTWDTTGNSKETAAGFVTGTLYTSAGTKDPVLTVTTPDGETDDDTTAITVVAQATEFPATDTFCFAADDLNWTGCPLAVGSACTDDNCTVMTNFATIINSGDNCNGTDDCSNADATAHRAIYLRGGDTFTGSGEAVATVYDATQPGLITKFGTGRPTIDAGFSPGSGWILSGLDLGTSTYGGDDVTNVTHHDLTINTGTCIHFSWSSGVGSTEMSDTIAFVDVVCPGGGTVNVSFAGGIHWWVAGMDVDRGGDCDGAPYTLRTKSIQWWAFHDNRFVGNCVSGNHIQIRAEDEFGSGYPGTGAGTVEDWAVKFNDFSNLILEHTNSMPGFAIRVCNDSGCNAVGGCEGSYPTGCGGAGGSGVIVPVHDFVFEDVYVRMDGSDAAGGKRQLWEVAGRNIKISNPIVDYRDGFGENANDIGLVAFLGETDSLNDGDPDAGTGLYVLNPTFVANYTGGTYTMAFQWVRSESNFGASGCKTNGCFMYGAALYWVSGWSGTVDTTESGLSVSGIPAVVTSNPFLAALGAQPADKTDFQIDGGSAWYQAGYDYVPADPAPLLMDAFGNVVPSANVSAGAHQP